MRTRIEVNYHQNKPLHSFHWTSRVVKNEERSLQRCGRRATSTSARSEPNPLLLSLTESCLSQKVVPHKETGDEDKWPPFLELNSFKMRPLSNAKYISSFSPRHLIYSRPLSLHLIKGTGNPCRPKVSREISAYFIDRLTFLSWYRVQCFLFQLPPSIPAKTLIILISPQLSHISSMCDLSRR